MSVVGTYLVVKCEKCGKKYGTHPDKLKKKEVKFPCKDCGEIVIAVKPDEVEPEPEVVESEPVRRLVEPAVKGVQGGGAITEDVEIDP